MYDSTVEQLEQPVPGGKNIFACATTKTAEFKLKNMRKSKGKTFAI